MEQESAEGTAAKQTAEGCGQYSRKRDRDRPEGQRDENRLLKR